MEINKKIERTTLSNIEIIQNEDVYDITVPGNANFFADGILVHNCAEIGMMPTLNGESGFQYCNLTEINGGKCSDVETFHRACKAASILGTIQAGYTNFKYLSGVTKKITEKEALIGVSITGWMNNPEVLFDKSNMISGSNIVKETNKEIANLIGINQAARTTTVKPSGNACARIDTKIKTNHGIMTMMEVLNYISSTNLNEIPVGSYVLPEKELHVYDEFNYEQKVTGFYNNGVAETYDITFEDGTTYGFTGNHKLKTTNGWKFVSELTIDDDIISH